MRIIHCADLHLNSAMESNFSARKAKLRREEMLSTYANMVRYAKDNGVTAILIAGDMFDTSRPDTATFEYVKQVILTYPEIDFLYFAGNHDESVQSESVFSSDLANAKVFTSQLTTFAYGNIKISGATDMNSAQLSKCLALSKDDVNILVMHGQVGSGADVDLAQLADRHIDYLALGHYHTYSTGKIDKRGIYCYSGTLEGRGYDECGQKGFVLLDIDKGAVKSTFVPFACRTLHAIDVCVTGLCNYKQVEDALISATQSITCDDIVKITLVGEVDQSTYIDTKVLQSFLDGEFFSAKLYNQTTQVVDTSEYAKELSLRGEFVRQVLASDLDAKTRDKVILCGIKALRGDKDFI